MRAVNGSSRDFPKHALGDVRDSPVDLAEPMRPRCKDDHDQRRPLVGQPIQNTPHGTLRTIEIGAAPNLQASCQAFAGLKVIRA